MRPKKMFYVIQVYNLYVGNELSESFCLSWLWSGRIFLSWSVHDNKFRSSLELTPLKSKSLVESWRGVWAEVKTYVIMQSFKFPEMNQEIPSPTSSGLWLVSQTMMCMKQLSSCLAVHNKQKKTLLKLRRFFLSLEFEVMSSSSQLFECFSSFFLTTKMRRRKTVPPYSDVK